MLADGLFGEVTGEHDNHAQLGELRWLHLHRPDVYPPLGTSGSCTHYQYGE
jgi:hypothetical protein